MTEDERLELLAQDVAALRALVDDLMLSVHQWQGAALAGYVAARAATQAGLIDPNQIEEAHRQVSEEGGPPSVEDIGRYIDDLVQKREPRPPFGD